MSSCEEEIRHLISKAAMLGFGLEGVNGGGAGAGVSGLAANEGAGQRSQPRSRLKAEPARSVEYRPEVPDRAVSGRDGIECLDPFFNDFKGLTPVVFADVIVWISA